MECMILACCTRLLYLLMIAAKLLSSSLSSTVHVYANTAASRIPGRLLLAFMDRDYTLG